MKPLLAKSYKKEIYPNNPPNYALLTQHSRDVAEACAALSDVVGRIGLECLGLDKELFEQFKLELTANGWLQDTGKATSQFDEMLSGIGGTQLLRHETISGLLAFSKNLPLREWFLQKFTLRSLLTIIWAAMGHHRKFDKGTAPKQALRTNVYVSHPDFKQILDDMGQDLKLGNAPEFEKDIVITPNHREVGEINAQLDLRDLQEAFENAKELFADESDKKYLALIKGLGIAADVAASAVAGKKKANYSLARTITEDFAYGLKEADFSEIIGDLTPYPFQEKVAASDAYLTFAQAGCGAGKSLAAYLWALAWCLRFAKQGRTNFRLIFCLPTTGTVTEHFKDYALESGIPPKMLHLSHSRSSVDLQTIAQTTALEEANENSKNPAQEMLAIEQDKIEALALWSTPLVVATSDTVLGLMANARKSVYSFPAILNSAIVFDEIHAFDDHLFGHLLVFLKNFPRLPIFLMTASLPEKRLEAIKKVRPDLTDEFCINGDKEFAEIERYAIEEVSDEETIWNEIENCIKNNGKNNGKVLWVQNRVDWANAAFNDERIAKLKEKYSQLKVDIYHARLKYKHRSKRHRRVIKNFKNKDIPVVLIATQVAEMSLDLSADLLVTDLAPIWALIQRLGRLNRIIHKLPENEREIKKALVCLLTEDKATSKPYKLEDMQNTRKWISKLKEDYGSLISQKNLADCFGEFSDEKEFDIETAEKRAVFFSGLWETYPGTTRADGYTINVILEEDHDEWKRLNGDKIPDKNWLRENEVAIPIRNEVFGWETIGGLRVAKNEHVVYDYDPDTDEGTGASWRK